MSSPSMTRRAFGAGAATAALAAAAGCSSKDKKQTPTTGKALEKITFITGFGSFGREGFAWVAQDKGYFKEAGFDVTIQPGAAGDINIGLVESGKAQFAEIDYSGAVVRAGTGKFDTLRCVAALNQRTLIALMALEGGKISSPRDLAGKKIGVATGAVPKTLFPAYAGLVGIDANSVTWVQTTPPTLPSMLANRQVDAIGQFVYGEPAVSAAAKGAKITVLPYGDFITDLYGNVLITTTKIIQDDPDKVRRFNGAILKAIKYTTDNPEECGQILHKLVTLTPAAVATKEMVIQKAYLGEPFGKFENDRVARSIATIQSVGLIPAGYDPKNLVNFDLVPDLS